MSFLRSKRFAIALMPLWAGLAHAETPTEPAAAPTGTTLTTPAPAEPTPPPAPPAPAESPTNPAPPPAVPTPAPQAAAAIQPAKDAQPAPVPTPPAEATSPSRDVGGSEKNGVSEFSRRKIRDTVRKLDDLLSH